MESTSKQSLRSPNWTDSRVLPIKVLRSQGNEHRHPESIKTLIGESEVIQDLKRSIRIVATSSETVLITGESGTGKELVARAVHDLSARHSQPFLAINCGALTESLLESELFGHVRGSFTGATANKKGLFEAAGGGTIFLDEFAEMSLAMQAKLLRVLQERKVRPVGVTNTREIEIDARVLVATNHDLRRDISEGKFRSDLYYRVNVLELHAPPLRERPEDILPLTQHFIRNYNEKNTRQVSGHFDSEAMQLFEAYTWPGNVRELENITKRVALSKVDSGIITASDLHQVRELSEAYVSVVHNATDQHLVSTFGCHSTPGAKCRCQRELDLYNRRLGEVGGNLTVAARNLNIHRDTLRKRLISLKQNCLP
jgi:transcriptional regulator with PAS, ATPase and Fis domain